MQSRAVAALLTERFEQDLERSDQVRPGEWKRPGPRRARGGGRDAPWSDGSSEHSSARLPPCRSRTPRARSTASEADGRIPIWPRQILADPRTRGGRRRRHRRRGRRSGRAARPRPVGDHRGGPAPDGQPRPDRRAHARRTRRSRRVRVGAGEGPRGSRRPRGGSEPRPTGSPTCARLPRCSTLPSPACSPTPPRCATGTSSTGSVASAGRRTSPATWDTSGPARTVIRSIRAPTPS